MLGYLLSPVLQIEDINGLPLVNGKVYVYEANTSNLATIYSNYEGTLNTNPAILDLAGHTTIIADDEMMYDITVKDKDDNLLFSAKDIAVGGEGGSAIVSDVTVRASGNGISVVQSVENNTKVFTVSIDYNFVASKTDLNSKQNVLTPGANISISGDTISVTGLKTINVAAPLQKTETTSAINLSIDPSGIQTPLSAGTNIDVVKLSNNIIDLKHDNCSASINSIAIGRETVASGNCSFAEGLHTSAFGDYSHTEGYRTNAADFYSHSEGDETSAIGRFAHSEGRLSIAQDNYSHAEGERTSAVGTDSHSEGFRTIAAGIVSHAEGDRAQSIGQYSHAEGDRTQSIGQYSHTEGRNTSAVGEYSHAEGEGTIANSPRSHAEGYETTAGFNSHSEGALTMASGTGSHAEGWRTTANGARSHAEGWQTTANGIASHTEGERTIAAADYSHAGGQATIASGAYQTVIGQYNNPNTTDLFQIGCGSADNARQNALEVKSDKSVWYNYNGSMIQLIPAISIHSVVYATPTLRLESRNYQNENLYTTTVIPANTLFDGSITINNYIASKILSSVSIGTTIENVDTGYYIDDLCSYPLILNSNGDARALTTTIPIIFKNESNVSRKIGIRLNGNPTQQTLQLIIKGVTISL